MKLRILAKIIESLTDRECYAFVSATILTMSRRSGVDTDEIIDSIKRIMILMRSQHSNDQENVR